MNLQENKQYWDVKKAAQRLSWRMTSKKRFIPNENDQIALKSLLAEIDRLQVKREDFFYFTKLLVVQLIQNSMFYKTTFIDKFPTKDIIVRLNTPYKVLIEELHSTIHGNLMLKLNAENSEELRREYLQLQETFTLDYLHSKVQEVATLLISRCNGEV